MSLNPCFDGMKIELFLIIRITMGGSRLNPCFNGTKIESTGELNGNTVYDLF